MPLVRTLFLIDNSISLLPSTITEKSIISLRNNESLSKYEKSNWRLYSPSSIESETSTRKSAEEVEPLGTVAPKKPVTEFAPLEEEK